MYDDDMYALTDDERAAGLGDLLHGNYDSASYKKKTYQRKYKSPLFRKNHGKKWTDSEIEEVNDLFISGNSVSDIALLQDRSNYSIAWRLHDSNLITFDQRESLKSGAGGVYYKNTRPSKTAKPRKPYVKQTKKASNSNETGLDELLVLTELAIQKTNSKEVKKTTLSAAGTSSIKVADKTSELKDINQKPKIEEDPYFLNVINTHTKFFLSISLFLFIWLMIFLLNQIVFFGVKFDPLLSLPHTSIIAAFVTYLIIRNNS